MRIAKRVLLFMAVNILVLVTISILIQVLGIRPYLSSRGIDYGALMGFCLIWGMGGAFISLALSRIMAKFAMGVKVIDPRSATGNSRWLVEKVHDLARQSGLPAMPEVGIYESPEVNAFATGPTKSRALVAVSTGLLQQMREDEIEGVLAHEVAHISNGDMVTMTLIQGVVNAFVMFIARVIAFAVSNVVRDDGARAMVNFLVTIVLEIALSFLGMMVVAYFSRIREFRADSGGAQLAGKERMISALARLQQVYEPSLAYARAQGQDAVRNEKYDTLKISGRTKGLLSLLASHPALSLRIQRLQESA